VRSEIIEALVEEAVAFDPKISIYLGGSYVSKTFTEKSDIDLLIICNKKQDLAKRLTKKFKSVPEFKNFDCKILTKKDLIMARDKHYLFLFSFISKGKLLKGKPINVKISKHLLLREFEKMIQENNRIKEMIENEQDSNAIACSLYNLAKYHHFMGNIIDPIGYQSIDQSLGEKISSLSQIYNSTLKRKGKIHLSLDTTIFVRFKASKIDFERIVQIWNHLDKHQEVLRLKLEEFQF
jgi:predicted nucleotidyltransferase